MIHGGDVGLCGKGFGIAWVYGVHEVLAYVFRSVEFGVEYFAFWVVVVDIEAAVWWGQCSSFGSL